MQIPKLLMKKNYAYLLSLIISGLTLTLVSCSDDEYTPIEDILPVAIDDFATYPLAESVQIPVLSNDTTGDEVIPTTVSIVGGEDTDSNGTLDKLVVNNEGIWTVNTANGIITFTPSESFLGNPTVIKYTVEDLEGNVSNQANITVTAVSIAAVFW